MLVENQIDFGESRNLVIASVVLIIGIGGAKLDFSLVTLEGMALAAIVGVILNLVLPKSPYTKENEKLLDE